MLNPLTHKYRYVSSGPNLFGPKPDVPHVVADGLGGRHGAGQLPGLDDGSATQLDRLGAWPGRGADRRGYQDRSVEDSVYTSA